MSAINDALKKTQSALNKQPIPETSAFVNVDSPEKPSTKPSRFSQLFEKIRSTKFHEDAKEIIIDFLTNKFFISAISGLLLLGISIPAFHSIHQFVQYKNIILQKIQKSETPSKLPASSATTPIEKPSNLILDGTLQSGNAHVALINNQLYHAGDTVNGFKIIEVHYNYVTLFDTKTQKAAAITTGLS